MKKATCLLCGEAWPRDPRLEVPCPDCGAAVGSRCKRPSEHTASEIHIAREQLAVDLGFLSKRCPAYRGEDQMSLIEGAA